MTSAGHTRNTKRCPWLFCRLMDAKTGVWTIRNNHNRRHVSKSARKDPFGLRNLPLDAAEGPDQHDVFYTNMAPVVGLLRAIGALPIRTLPVDSRAAAGNWYGSSYVYFVMRLVPEPSAFEVEMVIEKLKRNISAGINQTPANCLKQGVEQFARRSINLLIIFRLRRNCLKSEERRGSIIVPIYKTGDKTECNKYRGITLLSTTYKISPNILLQKISSICTGNYWGPSVRISKQQVNYWSYILHSSSTWENNGNRLKQCIS